MRRSRRYLLLLTILLLFGGFLFSVVLVPKGGYDEFANHPKFGMSHFSGWCAGARDASRDLVRGNAVVVVPAGTDLTIDKNTGLVRVTLGDVIDSGLEGYAAGYNSFVKLWISARGIPRNSRKQWESIVLDAAQYFDKRSKTEAPISLTPDAPPVFLADGKTQVFLKSFETAQHDLEYVLHWGRKKVYVWHFYTGILDCFEGPSGSDFVIVRFQQKRIDGSSVASTAVLDLRYEATIQGE